MIKYIITKEIEVEESEFDCEQIGVFDTEEEAIHMADIIHAEMTDFERYYYEIIVFSINALLYSKPLIQLAYKLI